MANGYSIISVKREKKITRIVVDLATLPDDYCYRKKMGVLPMLYPFECVIIQIDMCKRQHYFGSESISTQNP